MPGDPTTPPRVPDKAPTPPAVGSVRPWWRGWPLPWMSLLVTALVAGTAGGWWLTRQAQAPQGWGPPPQQHGQPPQGRHGAPAPKDDSAAAAARHEACTSVS